MNKEERKMEITMRNDKNIKWNDSLIVGIMPGS